MNVSRPIDQGIFVFAVAWFAVAIFTAVCAISIAWRGQSILGKVLYAVGGVCLLAVPAAIALNIGLRAWYGGKPDPFASVAGNFFVREKHRLTPVSGEEYVWLQAVQHNENWYLKPCAFGAAALVVGRLIRPRMKTRKNEKPGLL